MPLKLPPKLQSPYTLAEWKELEYKTDSKFLNAIRDLNFALIDLKRTKPPTAAAFEAFTTQTAYLIKRLKPMLNDDDMPEAVYDDYAEPFYILLRDWQKKALKIEDVLSEKEEDAAAEIMTAKKALQQNFQKGQDCEKRYKTLAQKLVKAQADIAKSAAFIKKAKPDPALIGVYDKLAPDKNLAAFQDEQNDLFNTIGKLMKQDAIGAIRDNALKFNDRDLASLCGSCSTQLASLDKLGNAIGLNIEKYEKAADQLRKDIEALIGLKLKR